MTCAPGVGKPIAVKVRPWRAEDIPAIVDCHAAVYPDYPPSSLYNARHYQMQLAAFPEGQFLAEKGDRVVGYATSIIVQLGDEPHRYTYGELTGNSSFSTHDPAGDTLYGADIGVHPEVRGRGVAARLYAARKKLMRQYNLRRMIAYGRLPGYSQHSTQLTAEEYVEKVVAGELKDPALTAHLKAGYRVLRIMLNFFSDRSSQHYCTLLEMENPDFRPERRRIASSPLVRPVRKLRVCAAQYLMRPIQRFEELEATVQFFADTADAYYCHVLLLPELFTAQLFSTMPPDMDSREAIRRLVAYHERYLDMARRLAQEKRIYLIAGSTPVERDGKVYNVAHLVSPTGNVYTQDKLHITPGERRAWGITPGRGLKVFSTPHGRFAIQVCYDIEFPEPSRLLAEAGVEVVFVPFSTDDRKAYYRVRYSAHARAIENVFYLALAGNVGNLPAREYLINYGQAVIVTPSDLGFPPNAVAAEADPNTETVVIADLDFTSLSAQREVGSVRPLYDRRHDLFSVSGSEPIELVRVE